MRTQGGMRAVLAAACGLVLGVIAVCPVSAVAAGTAGAPRWTISSVAQPTMFTPGEKNAYELEATNVGGETAEGATEAIKIKDTPPPGAQVTEVLGAVFGQGEAFAKGGMSCPTKPTGEFECTYAQAVAPGDTLRIEVKLDVTHLEGEAVPANEVTISGGQAGSAAAASKPTRVVSSEQSAQQSFGFANLITATSTPQAGGHPNFTTSFTLDTKAVGKAVSNPRAIAVELPSGFLGDPRATPTCSPDAVGGYRNCPEDAAVGVATIKLGALGTEGLGELLETALVYNITPYPGEPAAFEFDIAGLSNIRLDTEVVPDPSAPGGYVVAVVIPEISQREPVLSSSVTLWGTPADFNGPGPDHSAAPETSFGGPGARAGSAAQGFMRNPTACEASSLAVSFEALSWQNQVAEPVSGQLPVAGEGFSECSVLSALFTPSLELHPDASTELAPGVFQAGKPSGYEVGLDVPQSELAQQLSTPDVKGVTVTLPGGVVASPSFANGLTACSKKQFAQFAEAEATCAPASQIGTVEIESPLLETPLKGQLFLGEPECSPCSPAQARSGAMVPLFLQAQYGEGVHAGEYVRIKLIGHTSIDQQTGQLTTHFDDNPQLPFSKLTVRLEGGANAALANPSVCGTATATAEIAPWSGGSAAKSEGSFEVQGCAAPRFSPSFAAGSTGTTRGGAYTPFSVSFGREDADQDLSQITLHTPPGILGMVSHVTQCGEAQANEGTCPTSSEIGSVSAAVGPGTAPYWITGGKAFLTGPYQGKPFGLSIVVPAKAGPFTLAGQNALGQEGKGAVVVRASIAVDSHTAALTVASNPMPQTLDGISLQVRRVVVNVNREQFMRNATNCNAMAIAASIASAQGTAANVSSPYQAKDCAGLPFSPGFAVSTKAAHSKADGAALNVKVTYLPGQANIAKVHVTLPKALPSRDSTLKQACTEAQFAANPAGCPAGSFVGTAVAHTPVLNSALIGPAIFVSHGGAAFPDLDIVLQGEGVTVILTGNTDISNGITSSTFASVPDVPVSSFELTLPQGPHSALAAFGNLCQQIIVKHKRVRLRVHGRWVHRNKKVLHVVKRTLIMPTTITGQNGAVAERETKIAVSGCSKANVKASSHKRHAHKKHHRKTGKGRGRGR